MAIDAYVQFTPYSGAPLQSEYEADFPGISKDPLGKGLQKGKLFELEHYSIEVEQTLNIGSQSTGAGAGKVTFRPLTIVRKIDRASPILFQNACSGTPFKTVTLIHRRPTIGAEAQMIYIRYDFKLAAVKTISWNPASNAPSEAIAFEYGGLVVQYAPQSSSGKIAGSILGGWNRVKNVIDVDPDHAIQ